jgi:hypothetical protein
MTGFFNRLFGTSTPEPTPQERRQQELDQRKELWRTSVHARAQLQHDLSRLYLKAAPGFQDLILPKEYLATVINTIGDMYEGEFPPEFPNNERGIAKLNNLKDAYKLFVATFLYGLIEFTKSFPVEARIPVARSTPTPFTRVLPVFTGDEETFTPEMQTAFRALCAPFLTYREKLQDCGVFDWNDLAPHGWHEFSDPKPSFEEEDFSEREPIYGDPEERRRWRRDKREFEEAQRARKRAFETSELSYWESSKKLHEKSHKELHAAIRPWETTFFSTPFYRHYNQLIPQVTVPFTLPPEKRFGGHYIIAPSQRGKTTLMTAMMLEDFEQVMQDKASVVIIDPKGDLIDTIPRLSIFANSDKLIYIDPDDKIAINPLDIDAGSIDHTVENIDYMFSSFADTLTKLQSTLLRPTIRGLLLDWPTPTLATLRDILSGGLKLDRSRELLGPFASFASNHSDPDLRTFFCNEFCTTTYSETKDQVLRRLRDLSENQIMKHWFTTKKTKFDIGKEIDKAKVIVINNSYNTLTPSGCELMGRFFIAQLRAAGERRKSSPKNLPVYLYLDECDQVIKTDGNIGTIIDKLASKRIGLVAAHQRMQHFKGNEDTLDALLNSAIKMANARDDAEALAKRFPVHLGGKLHLSPAELRQPTGSFATYVADNVPESLVVKVEKPTLDYMTEAQQAAIRAKMRLRYGQDTEPTPAPSLTATAPTQPPKANGHDLEEW